MDDRKQWDKFFILALNSEQTELLLQEIRQNEINNPKGTNLQKLMSRFTLNTICGMNLWHFFLENIKFIVKIFNQSRQWVSN